VINRKVAPNILFYFLAKSHNCMSPLGISFYLIPISVINRKVAPNILFYFLAKSHNCMCPLGISFYLFSISLLMKKIKEKSEILFTFLTEPGSLTQPVTRLPKTCIVATPHRQSPLSLVGPTRQSNALFPNLTAVPSARELPPLPCSAHRESCLHSHCDKLDALTSPLYLTICLAAPVPVLHHCRAYAPRTARIPASTP
jgi:hypothetical protein